MSKNTKAFPLFLFLIFCAANLFAWSHLDFLDRNKEDLPIYKLIKNKEIKYCTHIGKDEPFTNEDLHLQIYAAFTLWTKGAASALKIKQKPGEFDDIIAFLNSGLKFTHTGECGEDKIELLKQHRLHPDLPDMIFLADQNTCRQMYSLPRKGESFPGYYQQYRKPYICLGSSAINSSAAKPKEVFEEISQGRSANIAKHLFVKRDSFATLIHEIGHAFGLADEYKRTDYRASHPRTLNFGRGAMESNAAKGLSYDDIEGLITIIDRVNNKTDRIIDPSISNLHKGYVKNNYYYPSKSEIVEFLKDSGISEKDGKLFKRGMKSDKHRNLNDRPFGN